MRLRLARPRRANFITPEHEAAGPDRKWGALSPERLRSTLTRIRGRARLAVTGADSAITLDGQSRVAMGMITYVFAEAR